MTTRSEDPLLDALKMKGVLIAATVRYWRGRRKLAPEDLGLDPAKVDDRLIALGQKRLIPKDALQPFAQIEGRTHALVEESSFPFLKGLARYVPNARLPDLIEKLKAGKAEFEAETRRFIDRWGDVRMDALKMWRAAAIQLVPDPELLLQTIEEAFPLTQEMSDHFSFDWSIFQLSAPESVRLAAFNAAESEAVLEARRLAAQEAKKAIQRNAEEFIAECVSALRFETATLCGEMLKTINNSESVNQKTLNRLQNFIDRFKSMNFVNDAEMDQKLEEVRQQILVRTAADYRESAYARKTLVQGLQELRETAIEMARTDNRELAERFGQLGRRRFAEVG